MEDKVFELSFNKVLDLLLKEERANIRKFYLDTLGKPTADMMDTYEPTESEILKILK